MTWTTEGRVKEAVRRLGSVEAAWQEYREQAEYFDGEVEIERDAKRRFYAAAGVAQPG